MHGVYFMHNLFQTAKALHYVIQPDLPAIYLRFILALRMNSFFRIYLSLVEVVIYR